MALTLGFLDFKSTPRAPVTVSGGRVQGSVLWLDPLDLEHIRSAALRDYWAVGVMMGNWTAWLWLWLTPWSCCCRQVIWGRGSRLEYSIVNVYMDHECVLFTETSSLCGVSLSAMQIQLLCQENILSNNIIVKIIIFGKSTMFGKIKHILEFSDSSPLCLLFCVDAVCVCV